MKLPFFLMNLILSLLTCLCPVAQAVDGSREIDFEKTLPWSVQVLGGVISTQPVQRSYGFAACGEGRQIYGFTDEGKTLWQTKSPSRLKNFITPCACDMILCVTEDSTLLMVNPDGKIIWKCRMNFQVMSAPIQARDGRIYVTGKKNVASIGLNGITRWSMQTEELSEKLTPIVMNDNSLLCFYRTPTADGKNAFLMNQFGTPCQYIDFPSVPYSCQQTQQGAILSLEDGSLIHCTAAPSSREIKFLWKKNLNFPARIVCDQNSTRCVLINESSREVMFLNLENGKMTAPLRLDLDLRDTRYAGFSAAGFIICTSSHALCIKQDLSTPWKARFNPRKKFRFALPSDSGYMILCNGDWSLELYLTKMNFAYKDKKVQQKKLKNTMTFIDDTSMAGTLHNAEGSMNSSRTREKISADFKKGNFGSKERDYVLMLSSEMENIVQSYCSKAMIKSQAEEVVTWYISNPSYCKSIIELASLCGVSFIERDIVKICAGTENKTVIDGCIKAMANIGYDEGDSFVDSLDLVLQRKTDPKDLERITLICDAMVSIYRTNGSRSYLEKGKNIMSYIFRPQFPQEAKEIAASHMKEISMEELEIKRTNKVAP
ncbi:MAG: hypothetical protein MJZ50_06505 [Treponema sp.]|nr:hypothetical protein [Treponema sp.]